MSRDLFAALAVERGLQVERQLDSWGTQWALRLERLCGCHHRMQTLNASGEDVVLRRTTAVRLALPMAHRRQLSEMEPTGIEPATSCLQSSAAARRRAGFCLQNSWYLGSGPTCGNRLI